MDRFDNDPTPIDDGVTPITDPLHSGQVVDPDDDTPVTDPLRALRKSVPSLEFRAYDSDPGDADGDVDGDADDDETAISYPPTAFPPVDLPTLEPIPLDHPHALGWQTTTQKQATQKQATQRRLPESDTPPPPPLMVPPRPHLGRHRLTATQDIPGHHTVDMLLLIIAFLAGVIMASLVFLGVTYLRQ